MAVLANLRSKLARAGWPPRSRLGQIAFFIFAVDIGLYVAQRIAVLLGRSGTTFGGWVGFLTFVSAILFTWLWVRILREKVLWRLRNRLIVTYVFIGVIPVILLVTLAITAFYLFAGQFATFIVTSDLRSELRSIETANSALAHELAARLDQGLNLDTNALQLLRQTDPDWADRQIAVWHNSKLVLNSTPTRPSPTPTLSASLQLPFSGIVRDKDELFLRSAVAAPARSGRVIVLSSEPLDQHLLEKLSKNLGEITLLVLRKLNQPSSASSEKPGPEASDAGTGKQTQRYELDLSSARPVFTAGTVPAANSIGDPAVTFLTSLWVINWETAATDNPAGISVQTRMSVLFARLFASLGAFAPTIEFLLLLVAIAFAVIELIALLIGVGLSRTITGSIANLYRATQHINSGNLSHRIQVTSRDQLATLETSFNHMTESLEKLLDEQKEKQRLENELVIAQEVQAQLFPKEISQLESLEVHGFCRPARTVSGDYYDFLALNPHRLTLAVGDVSGKGISAALLMATIHSAVRAYSLETIPAAGVPAGVGFGSTVSLLNGDANRNEISPAAMLSLLNHQLYESTPTEKYATLFLAVYDGVSRTLTYSNGGHLPPIILGPTGAVRRLEAGGMVVGLFDNMSFDEGTAALRPGDIFIAYSDGVTEPENDFGEFGETRLIDLVRDNQHLPLVRISEIVSAAVYDWIGANEQPDDITLVLARAR
jgi:phosphoserine phosphatase RsbU/P